MESTENPLRGTTTRLGIDRRRAARESMQTLHNLWDSMHLNEYRIATFVLRRRNRDGCGPCDCMISFDRLYICVCVCACVRAYSKSDESSVPAASATLCGIRLAACSVFSSDHRRNAAEYSIGRSTILAQHVPVGVSFTHSQCGGGTEPRSRVQCSLGHRIHANRAKTRWKWWNLFPAIHSRFAVSRLRKISHCRLMIDRRPSR